MTSRRLVTLWVATAAVGSAVALSLAGRERVLAVFALLLLCGAGAAALLLRRIVGTTRAAADPFRQPVHERELRVPQLDDLVHDVEMVLEVGYDARGDLSSRLRIFAAARLAERRGIDLDTQPERARGAIDAELTWALVRERPRAEPADDPALGAAQLGRVLESLERIR